MSEQKDDGSYYAKGGGVWKSPVVTKMPEGGSSISIGFQVCKMTDIVGDEGVEAVAELMNRGDRCPTLAKALEDLLDLCLKAGDFKNGVTHQGIDEGEVFASGIFDQAQAALRAPVSTTKVSEQ